MVKSKKSGFNQVIADELDIKFTNFSRGLDETLGNRFTVFKTEIKKELTKDIVEGVSRDLRDLFGPPLAQAIS